MMSDLSEHGISVQSEPGDAIWHSLTQAPTAPGTAYRPTCSCGWEATLTHDTEEGAQRAGEVHVTVSMPPQASRYVLAANGDDTNRLECAECAEVLLHHVSHDGSSDRVILDAITAHDQDRHSGRPEVVDA